MEFPISRIGDRFTLLTVLAAALRDDDLLDIARCDYGTDADLHLAQLRRIASLAIPSPLKWHPAEVLELTRWSEATAEATPEAILRTHRQRAFCCTALLAAMGDPETVLDGCNSTLIQLIESLGELRLSVDQEAADLLTWLIRSDPELHASDRAFLGLGLLHFALSLPRWTNARLMDLINWIEEAARECRRGDPNAGANGTWLLSTTKYDQLQMKWRQLGPKLVDRLADHHSEQVIEKVRLIASLLSQKS
ncbi:hypothetical protein [Bradyrhizobium sp. S3.9.1]|uniref:hypothetical protein n=1 Tax=Bradyrhizobium sp. S3.9.1 TaxID=3156431 RepID=UPI0033997B0D